MDDEMERLEKYLRSPIPKRSSVPIRRPGPQAAAFNASEPSQTGRPKPAGPNRRAQVAGASRNPGPVDRTKDLSKLANQSEDKAQGWDKPNLKKKRSVLKPEGNSERKQSGAMLKLGGADSRPKSASSLSAFSPARFGASLNSGAVSEQGNPNSPRAKPRTGQEIGNQRKGFDKDGNLKAVTKLTDAPNSPARPKPSGSFNRAPQDSDDPLKPGQPKRSNSPVKPWGSQSQRPQKPRAPRKPKPGLLPSVGSPSSAQSGPATSAPQPARSAKDVTKRKRAGADVEPGAQKMGAVGNQRVKKKAGLFEEEDSDGGAPPGKKQAGRGGRAGQRPATGKAAGESGRAAAAPTKQRSARGGRPPVKKSNLRVKDGGSPSALGQSEDDKEEILAAAHAALAPGYALNDIFWKKNEAFFGAITDLDLGFINQEIASNEETNKSAAEHLAKLKGKAEFVPPDPPANGTGISVGWQNADVEPILDQLMHGSGPGSDKADVAPTLDQITHVGSGSGSGSDKAGPRPAVSMCHLLMSALISPDDLAAAANGTGFEMPVDLTEEDWTDPGFEEGSRSFWKDDVGEASTSGSVADRYDDMSVDEIIIAQLNEIGIFVELPDQVTGDQGDKADGPSAKKPDLASTSEDDSIEDEIARLQAQLYQQSSEANTLLVKAEQAARAEKESLHSEFAKRALDSLATKAHERYLATRGRSASLAAKLSAQEFMKRALDRVEEFQKTGKSVFDEPEYKELFFASLAKSGNPSAYVGADITQEEKRPAGSLKRKELSLDELSGNPTGPISKRKKSDSPSSSRPKPSARPKKPTKKREGLPPLYPKKVSAKDKAKERERQRDAETLAGPAETLAGPNPAGEKEPETLARPAPAGNKEGEIAGGPGPAGKKEGEIAGGPAPAGEEIPEGLDDFGGVQEVDSMGLDIPMDDITGLGLF